MTKRWRTSAWTKTWTRQFATMSRMASASGHRMLSTALKPAGAGRAVPAGAGAWTPGVAIGTLGTMGTRRFRLYRPPDMQLGERLPLMVMLHGCGQDANSFASSTRMNRIALRERFLVLYPEQDRLANSQGCWNWFDTGSGRAYSEAALIMQAINQVCLLHPVDQDRVAVAGLSAGASMAALLVTRNPGRFRAVVMHSGIPPGTAHSSLTALGAMHGRRPTIPLTPTVNTLQGTWPPLLVIHGDADTVVSPHNGRAAAQVWADAAGARAVAVRGVQRGRRHPMAVTDFKRQGRIVSTLVTVGGLAHAWSGGAAAQPYGDAQGPDASRMTWTFAAKQFRMQD